MKNYGYKVIDLGGTEIDTTGATITGVYEEITAADKPIMIYGFNNNGTSEKPFFATVYKSNTDYNIVFNTSTTIVITSASLVKLSA